MVFQELVFEIIKSMINVLLKVAIVLIIVHTILIWYALNLLTKNKVRSWGYAFLMTFLAGLLFAFGGYLESGVIAFVLPIAVNTIAIKKLHKLDWKNSLFVAVGAFLVTCAVAWLVITFAF